MFHLIELISLDVKAYRFSVDTKLKFDEIVANLKRQIHGIDKIKTTYSEIISHLVMCGFSKSMDYLSFWIFSSACQFRHHFDKFDGVTFISPTI